MLTVLNLREFEAGLDRWAARELPETISKVQLKIASDIFAALVRLSPVDTGRYRGSWTMAEGAPDESVLPAGEGPFPAPTLPAIRVAATWAALNVIWLANHLPYAERLEEGHSGQAPIGVAGPVLAGFAAAGISRGLIDGGDL